MRAGEIRRTGQQQKPGDRRTPGFKERLATAYSPTTSQWQYHRR